MIVSISLLSLLSVSLVWIGHKVKSGKLIHQIEGKRLVLSVDRYGKFAKMACRSCYLLGGICFLLILKLLVINQSELAVIYSLSMMLTIPKTLLLIYGAIRLIYLH